MIIIRISVHTERTRSTLQHTQLVALWHVLTCYSMLLIHKWINATFGEFLAAWTYLTCGFLKRSMQQTGFCTYVICLPNTCWSGFCSPNLFSFIVSRFWVPGHHLSEGAECFGVGCAWCLVWKRLRLVLPKLVVSGSTASWPRQLLLQQIYSRFTADLPPQEAVRCAWASQKDQHKWSQVCIVA